MKEYLREISEGVLKVVYYDSSRSGDIEIPEGATEAYYFDGSDPDGEIDLVFVQVSNKKLFQKNLCWSDVEVHNIEYIKKWGELVWDRNKETITSANKNQFNPLIPQEGGDHYKLRPIQPIEYSEQNGLSMSQGNIVKYITRHKEKNGIEDLAKVVHYALLEAYFVYDVKGSTELKQRILKMLGD